jgi:copper(I)-binding protein
MQHPVRNFLILVLAITSTLFFSNVSIAEGDAPTPESIPTTTDSAAPNAPAPAHRPADVTARRVSITPENITVTSARIKPSMAGSTNTAAFVSLHNSNKSELIIVGANVVTSDKPNASSIANRIELHNSITDNDGVVKMVQVNKLVVPIDGDLTMASGGTHIMLFDLKKNLKEGEIVFVNFTIQGLGTYQVQVPVKLTD